MAQLRLVTPKGDTVFRLGDAFSIGRLRTNALSLNDDRAVSRNHALIERAAQGYVLRDLGSANGTFIERGAQKIRIVGDMPLQQEDIVCIGHARLIYEDEFPIGQSSSLDVTLVPETTIAGEVLPQVRRPQR